MKKAVVLVSGGLDSATTLAFAKDAGFDLYALTFRYGQRHHAEITSAGAVAKSIGVEEHVILDVDVYRLGQVALASNMPIPKGRTVREIGNGIPETYVPARNTIFLSYALAWAEMIEASDIFTGVNAVDYSGYPDCRPEYIAAFQALARLATKSGVEGHGPITIHTPLIEMSKEQIVQLGHRLGVDYGITTTCYDPDDCGRACGKCDACILRRNGFLNAGIPDPTSYQPSEDNSSGI